VLNPGRSGWMASAVNASTLNVIAATFGTVKPSPKPPAWPGEEDKVRAAAEQITAYEDRVKAAARARIGTDLAHIQTQFRVDLAAANGNPARILEARQRAARSLRALRPAMGDALRGHIEEGVHLGARLAGGIAPKGVRPLADHAVKVTLQRMNTPIRRHARLSANAVMRMPVRTDRQVEDLIARIGAVVTEVDSAALVVASRAVDIGTTTVTTQQGVGRVWVTRADCCPVCAEYAGSVAPPGGGFLPRASYADHDGQWEEPHGGISGPPIHGLCRCYTVPDAPHLADRIARRQEADVAAGRIAASMPAKIRALKRMLADEANLTQRTRERAQRAAARGRFTGQRPVTTQRRPRSA